MTCFGFWDVAALSRSTSRLSRMVRWRIGKSALMAGTFSITFAGFAMRCPLAMPGSILESSCDGTSADAAPQFQFDEAVHRSEEHTSELQSRENLVCRLL